MATRKEQLGIDLRHNVGDFEDTKLETFLE